MTLLRIAYVCADPGIPPFGTKGASVHVREVIRALRRLGHEVTLFARRLDEAPPPDLASLRVIELPGVGSPSREERERRAMDANSLFNSLLQSAGPFDAVYERHSLWSYGAMEWAFLHEIPALLEVNAPLIEEQERFRGLSHRTLAEDARTRAFASADAILAVSSEVAERTSEHAAARGRVSIVPNGVDHRRFHPDVPPAMPRPLDGAGDVTIGFVGTLKIWHGVETLIEAFAIHARRNPQSRLLIVGDGPERATLQALASRLGIEDRTRFTGAVDPDQVPSLVTSMDIAAAPYPADPGHYFSPLKLFEYMAAGRAIIASRIGQIESVLEHDRTGVLVSPGDTRELAAAIDALGSERERRARLACNARSAAVVHHTWDAVALRIVDLTHAAAERRRCSCEVPA